MELTTIQSTSTVTIQGAHRACELEPTIHQVCMRSSHAPAPSIVGTTASEQAVWDADETIPAGAEVWQELVRMLVAREAARLVHPSRRAQA
jgi:hypothetical protein